MLARLGSVTIAVVSFSENIKYGLDFNKMKKELSKK